MKIRRQFLQTTAKGLAAAAILAGCGGKLEEKVSENDRVTKQQKQVGIVRSLAYLSGHANRSKINNVTLYDKERACNGFNFYVSGHAPAAFLMDMNGVIVHKWACSFGIAWPDEKETIKRELSRTGWRWAHLLKDGNVLAIFDYIGMVKLDKYSNPVWIYPEKRFDGNDLTMRGCHHEAAVADDGRIYVLTYKLHGDLGFSKLPFLSDEVRFTEDFITVLTPKGRVIKEISLVDCLLNSPCSSILQRLNEKELDILHANTVNLIDNKLASKCPSIFKEGYVLTSFLTLNTIAAVDLENETIPWAATGVWAKQHDPTLLDNGNILLFDNSGPSKVGDEKKSQIIEYNAATKEIVWSYAGTPTHSFYSESCGTAQRLPNGNTLIAESNAGRAFEITPEGEIVWNFQNPNIFIDNIGNEIVGDIFTMDRVSYESVASWLKRD